CARQARHHPRLQDQHRDRRQPPLPRRPRRRGTARILHQRIAAALGVDQRGAARLARRLCGRAAKTRPRRDAERSRPEKILPFRAGFRTVSAMPDLIRLRGIAWNHSRGFTPMVATAQRYGELHPHVEITWEKRSLQAFADAPIEKLAETFDLLVIDHPFAGFAAQHPVLHNLNQIASRELLADLRAHSTGASFESYDYDGNVCALPIDAATPISGWREDLLAHHRVSVPQTWEELLELARAGLVAVAGIPVDCLMNFFMFCHAHGETPAAHPDRLVSSGVGEAALAMQHELMSI